ncbi:hypothetical protein [Orenia marismortui]|uniref:hypothetical protein n=1 Tax=Orenia marismortui TaxID=46469 RepID=UPI00035DFCB2|nr:hypothetical protein [Orenia marismortui]
MISNKRKLLIIGVILVLSLSLAGCSSSTDDLDNNAGDDSQVWNSYEHSSFAVTYAPSWMPYEFEDVVSEISDSIESSEQFADIKDQFDKLEEEYNIKFNENTSVIEEIIYSAGELYHEVYDLNRKFANSNLEDIFTEEDLNRLREDYNLTDKEIKLIVSEMLHSLWLDLGKLKAYTEALEKDLDESALILPKKLDLEFPAAGEELQEDELIKNEFSFQAFRYTKDDLIDLGFDMPQNKEQFYQAIQLYAEQEYPNSEHSKFDMNENDYSAYKITAEVNGRKVTNIAIYKDGKAGWVYYQGTIQGYDNNSEIADKMAKSFKFK